MNVSLDEARNMPVLEQGHEADDSDYQDVRILQFI